ncbi:FeoA family protein [Anaerocolumna jejuensis]|uniref:FeoA family protein n=1 Tax=Anaerocolumna jejuensis TaxID=259063 RepID=UPI003F7BFF2C
MTLNTGVINQSYEIQKLNLPLNIEKRLEALGMTLGTSVDVLNNKNHGTLIIKVRGTRLAIGKGISKRISVKEIRE